MSIGRRAGRELDPLTGRHSEARKAVGEVMDNYHALAMTLIDGIGESRDYPRDGLTVAEARALLAEHKETMSEQVRQVEIERNQAQSRALAAEQELGDTTNYASSLAWAIVKHTGEGDDKLLREGLSLEEAQSLLDAHNFEFDALEQERDALRRQVEGMEGALVRLHQVYMRDGYPLEERYGNDHIHRERTEAAWGQAGKALAALPESREARDA